MALSRVSDSHGTGLRIANEMVAQLADTGFDYPILSALGCLLVLVHPVENSVYVRTLQILLNSSNTRRWKNAPTIYAARAIP